MTKPTESDISRDFLATRINHPEGLDAYIADLAALLATVRDEAERAGYERGLEDAANKLEAVYDSLPAPYCSEWAHAAEVVRTLIADPARVR